MCYLFNEQFYLIITLLQLETVITKFFLKGKCLLLVQIFAFSYVYTRELILANIAERFYYNIKYTILYY